MGNIKQLQDLRFKIGVLLLIINVPFGYGGIMAAGIIAAATDNRSWLVIGTGCYILSWVMLALGLTLVGPKGLNYVKKLRKQPEDQPTTPANNASTNQNPNNLT